MLEDHKGDNQVLACSGEPILVWPPSKKVIIKISYHSHM